MIEFYTFEHLKRRFLNIAKRMSDNPSNIYI